MSSKETSISFGPWPEIEWEDGYPTTESLDRLIALPYHHLSEDFSEDAYLRRTLSVVGDHCVASYEEEPATDILGNPVIHGKFSTGGWSGAEELIAAIEGKMFLDKRILSWRRGGHYVFEFKCEDDASVA